MHDLSSEQRFHLLAWAATGHGIIFLDPAGLIVEWSLGAEQLLGWAAREMLGQSVALCFTPEDQAGGAPWQGLGMARTQGQLAEFRWLLRKDGVRVWADTTTYAIHDKSGELIGFSSLLMEARAPTAEHEFLGAVLDNIEDGIVACNPEGELTVFNRATRNFHGLPEVILTPDHWTEYYDLYRADGTTPLPMEEIPLFRALQGERIRDARIVIAPKTGRSRTVSASGQLLIGPTGQKLGAVVSMHDITDQLEVQSARERASSELSRRYLAEEAADRIRLSEERFRSLVMAAAQVVWTANAQGEVCGNSPSWCAYTGQAPTEMEGSGWLDALHPDDLEHTARAWADSISQGIPYQAQYRLRQKDGSYRWTLARGALIRAQDGTVREWVGINSDIHPIKQAEEALRESERQAVEAAHHAEAERQRLDAVLEAVPVGILVADARGAILEVNPETRQLFGLNHPRAGNAEAYGEWKGWWADGSERHGQRVQPYEWPLSRSLRGENVESSIIEIESFETPPVRRIFLSSAAPILDAAGKITGGVSAVMDISDRIRAETSLRETAERLQFILESAQIGDWDLDLVNDVAYRSLRHDRCFGHNEPIPDWGFEEFLRRVHPEDRDRVREDFETSVSGFSDWHFECRVIWPDTSMHWIAAHGSVYGSEGKPTRMVGIVYDTTMRKEAEDKVRHASLHDPLTGLPNRAMLFEFAGRLLPHNRRTQQAAAVLFLDLDRFKPINDTHGHEVGDAVLKAVAERLVRMLRAEDLVIRLGGDEFLILLQDIRHVSYAGEVARHIMESINQPYRIGELMLRMSASIGISIFSRDGEDIDALVSHADMAMYQAKESGRNNCQFFSADLGAGTRQQQLIEEQLRVALKEENFDLHYQPVLDVSSGEVVSVEALLRLQDSDVGPGVFVPIAEATGFINPIGRWLLREASRQHRLWRDLGMPAIPIAVNVSVVEFRDRDFVDRFRTTLEDEGIDISSLQLELTETAVMDDFDHAVTVLSELKSLGVTILLDDFGTGHSSLAYLARLPLDKVKIDKSFIANLETDAGSRAVTEAMIALGRTLSLTVVAEGIESAYMLDFVRSRGCPQAQGFHLGGPMNASAFESWYHKHGQRPECTDSS